MIKVLAIGFIVLLASIVFMIVAIVLAADDPYDFPDQDDWPFKD